ncbi:MAG TPA: hypothetical protein PL196_11875 [Burkholderiaceae bacterium]|nr:hypothetical protein [Burkholderiaceae bacterium]
MIKLTQIFGWEHEPADERPSEFMTSRFGEPSAFAALAPLGRASDARLPLARKSPLMTPEANRAPPSERDRTLSHLVPSWRESLPPDAKAAYLCARFPRIANRLALCWADPSLALNLLDELFRDRRGGRRGFPAEALEELRSLRRVALQRIGHRRL